MKAAAGVELDFYLATKHYAVHYFHAILGLPPRVIAEQMGWTLGGVLKLLAVYGHGDVGALEEIDAAFARNVTPLRAVWRCRRAPPALSGESSSESSTRDEPDHLHRMRSTASRAAQV